MDFSVLEPLQRRRPTKLVLALAGVGALAVVAALVPTAHGGVAAGLASYDQHNLVSDQPGKAEVTDSDLVNAWGLAFGPSTPAWVANNHSDNSTLYAGGGGSPATKVPLTVAIPGGSPTGMVFNSSSDFPVQGNAANFIFSSEAGKITAWSGSTTPVTSAVTVAKAKGAIFKGLAIADAKAGPQIYATDFHNGKVDVWDGNFKPVKAKGAFRDPNLPKGYAPFGIQTLGSKIYVSYAKQDKKAEDDSPGKGFGFVDVYTTSGKLVKRLISRGALNSPWGMVIAPSSFGGFGGDLLVGNFGDGRINGYDPKSGKFGGTLENSSGKKLRIDGLWALVFGNGTIGTPDTLLFTAGPNGEDHGLFGELTPAG
jgi:uncharacterized protein (TIGR03118 family)